MYCVIINNGEGKVWWQRVLVVVKQARPVLKRDDRGAERAGRFDLDEALIALLLVGTMPA